DPREQPACDADYWVDNLRHTVRFGAAVRAALEDGYRVFAELSPHPLLTHAVEQTAGSLDMLVAVLAGMRREQPLPHGLGDFLANLHNAGAAVDFAILHPTGELVDAPLPAWTHVPLLLRSDSKEHQAQRAWAVAVHPLLGAHVRLPEEPERHAWQAEVGTAMHPWLGDHQIHQVATLPGAAYCEMALVAARTVLGEESEVRDMRFEQMLLLDEQTRVSAVASVATTPGLFTFTVETFQDGAKVRRASAALHAASEHEQPAVHDMTALFAAHPCRLDGDQLRAGFDAVGIQYGPAFTGLTAVHSGPGTVSTALAEVALPRSIRSQQSDYGIHPALLDACFQSVVVHPEVQHAGSGGLLLPLGVRRIRVHQSTRNAHYCLTRVTKVDVGGIEADLDVLDEHGATLLTLQGLQLGSGVSEHQRVQSVLNERLLAIEWQRRTLPELTRTEAGAWLLISTSDAADLLTAKLADALKLHGAQCMALSRPLHADHPVGVAALTGQLGVNEFNGVLVVTAPQHDNADQHCAQWGQQYAQQLVRIARELPELAGEAPRLYVVSRNAQMVVRGDLADAADLGQGGLRGLMRVIGAEHAHLRPTQIDVDQYTDVEQIALQLLSGSEEDETAWRNGEWYTARLCPGPLRSDERRTAIVDHEHDGMRLQIRVPGDLQTMEFVAFDRIAPGPGEIEVAVSASSINFADVLITFGRYPSFEGQLPQLGTDFAGVVTAVGAGVTDHQVGDRVGGMSPHGCWGTFVTCDAQLAVKLPPGLTEGQAAAVSTAYATAWHGLHDLARIEAGDKVLIHSATGGVGQAAIAIATSAGAQIFATAGSEQRRKLLRDMGINHVYDSRSTEFADQIRRDTGGYGVDVVLNALPGAAQLAGLELLSWGGRFIEIGKRDIYGDTKLGLFPFRRNLSFYGVDLALLGLSHPRRMRDLLSTVYQLTADGVLPLPESTHYPLAEAATAIRMMSNAEHTGKLVLDIPHTGSSSAVVPPAQTRVFRGDGSYLITGGLGGLGLFLAEKMAAAGCGRIVLTSRSAPSPAALEIIERIRAAGTDVVVECGDIAQPHTAEHLVSVATATGLAVRGVLHAAAVVEDATLGNITDELLARDWAPKVYGAWYLHQATAEQPLDWFCSFSSAAALVGSPGQGAYAAANSWLDAFTHWRRAQGLPATSIAWGAWAEVGRATALAESSGAAIAAEEGFYAFETLLRYNRGYTGYAPIVGTPWLVAFAQRSRFAELFQSAGKGRKGTSEFRAELISLPQEEWPSRLRRMIAEQISMILRRTIDPDRPLSEYGLDSLGNLEVRTRVETETGIRINPTDITTVRAVAEHLYEKLVAQEADQAGLAS
ncbi:MAG: SDR family NAD(P)-dependent oxidoreductase, partial [Mycobacteriaceae bacterium]|nr:SDR family NAD(P)-dependent oxidoreductase [Mycobacteriaceae bacterium]